MAKRPRTPYAVLGVLSMGPQSGYGIKRTIEQSTAHFWSESYGQIYPVLHQLEAEGLARQKGAKRGGRAAKIYELTRAGRDALKAWLRRPVTPQPPRLELLLKIFFGRHDPAAVRAHLDRHRAQQADLNRRYREIERALLQDHAGHADLPYWLATLRYGQRLTSATLAWCDETVRALDEAPPAQQRSSTKENER